MPNELQQNRYDQLVRRVGGMIGPGSKVGEAIGELFPVLELENTTPELLALSGWRVAWNAAEAPAVAGEVSAAQIFNPAESGVLVAVTALMIQSNVVTGITIGLNEEQIGGTPIRGRYRDFRFGGLRETTATTEATDNPTLVPGGLFIRVLAVAETVIRDDNGIAVLSPGSGLQLTTNILNARLTVNFFWRERAAEPSELSF